MSAPGEEGARASFALRWTSLMVVLLMAFPMTANASQLGETNGSVCSGLSNYAWHIAEAHRSAIGDSVESHKAWNELASLDADRFMSADEDLYLASATHLELVLSRLKRIERENVPEIAVDHYLGLIVVVDDHVDAMYELTNRGPNAVSGQSFVTSYRDNFDFLVEANRKGVEACGDDWPEWINLNLIKEDEYRRLDDEAVL